MDQFPSHHFLKMMIWKLQNMQQLLKILSNLIGIVMARISLALWKGLNIVLRNTNESHLRDLVTRVANVVSLIVRIWALRIWWSVLGLHVVLW